jgi:hypothetical protein
MGAKTALAICGLLAAVAAGCTDGGDAALRATPTTASSPTSAPTAEGTFVAQVNALCADLMQKVIGASGAHPGVYLIADFQADQPKLRALVDEFDAQVDALEVADGDRGAAEAFASFREMSDAEDEKLAAVAKSGDQERFNAAVEERHRTFDASDVLRNLAASGIACNAR